MRYPNQWTIIDHSDLVDLLEEHSVEDIAQQLKVSVSTVKSWQKGTRAPNRRFQFALSNLDVNFADLLNEEIGERISLFQELAGLDLDGLANTLGVSSGTARRYLDGTSRPRAIRQVAELLSTPVSTDSE